MQVAAQWARGLRGVSMSDACSSRHVVPWNECYIIHTCSLDAWTHGAVLRSWRRTDIVGLIVSVHGVSIRPICIYNKPDECKYAYMADPSTRKPQIRRIRTVAVTNIFKM